MFKTEMPLLPCNWRPLIFISLMIAQKMWDDVNILNYDFLKIYPFFTIDELNKLEQKFLQLIDYNIYIKYSVYFKYYLELRELYRDSPNQYFPLKPMDVFTQQKLEKTSLNLEENLIKNYRTSIDAKESGMNSNYVIN